MESQATDSPRDSPSVDRSGEPSGRGSAPFVAWPRRYVAAWVVSGLSLLSAYVWVRYSSVGVWDASLFVDGFVAVFAVAAAVALTFLGWRRNPPMRRGWRLVAVGVWFEAAGEVLWVGYRTLTGTVPYPGVPDVFYVAGYLFIGVGIAYLAFDPRDARPQVRFTLDGLVVATALLTVGWHFVLDPLLATNPLGSPETVASIAYPVFDILVASVALVVAMNARGPRRFPLALVAAGLFSWVVADVAFAAVEFERATSYAEFGLFWSVGDALIALGALHPDADSPTVSGRRRYEFGELVFPFLPFLLATGLAAFLGYTNALDRGDVVLACLAVVALVARQTYISRDVIRLGRDLERNERALARRNEELLLVNRIVRHDIRNDMAVASGWAGELEPHVDEAGESMLDRVRHSTQHTIALTETLRDFIAALEPGREAPIEPTPLGTSLRETVAECGKRYPEADVVLGDVPDVDVEANALLDVVFRNLLTNAIQHNDSTDP